jgi:hypothetical protein
MIASYPASEQENKLMLHNLTDCSHALERDNFFLVLNFNSHEKHLIHSIQMTTSKCGLSTIRLARRAKMA